MLITTLPQKYTLCYTYPYPSDTGVDVSPSRVYSPQDSAWRFGVHVIFVRVTLLLKKCPALDSVTARLRQMQLSTSDCIVAKDETSLTLLAVIKQVYSLHWILAVLL